MLKEDVLALVEPEEFYSEYFEGWKPKRNVRCVKADENHSGGDEKPSLSLSSDGKAYCHTCGFKATSPIGVVEAAENLSFADACARVYHLGVEPIVPQDYLAQAEQGLRDNGYVQTLLESRRGIGLKTAQRYGLGWDGRLTIPVKCALGFTVDVRRHDLLGKFSVKILSYKEGYGGARIWPLDQLKAQEIYLFEGELDTLLAIHQGLAAVTITSGAMTWNSKWNGLFRGKHVVVVPDMDKPRARPDGTTFSPGLDGAKKRMAEIAKAAASVRMVQLPVSGEKDEKDFTDWVMKKGGSAGALRELAKASATRYSKAIKEVDETTEADETDEAGEVDDIMEPFNKVSVLEELNIQRSNSVVAVLERDGAFYRNGVGEMFYAPRGARPLRVFAKSDAYLSHLSKIHPLVNSASSTGKFIIQHTLNKAQESSKNAHSASWSLFHDNSIYMYAGEDKIVKATAGKLEILKNAINDDKVLLETPAMSAPFVPEVDADIGEAVHLFWKNVISNLAVDETDQYLSAAWTLMSFFRDYVKAKPLIRLLASTASGKSTASRILSLFVYGDELLQHSATTTAALYAMAKSYPFLPLDNLETRNMTPALEDFLLGAATGGMKAKRAEGTDSGIVMESSGCLVLTNGIEPFSRHELIDRNIEIALDSKRFGKGSFDPGKVYSEIKRTRGLMLSGLLKMLSLHCVPRIKRGEIQRISHEFGPHAKDRFNECFAMMSIILDALWAFRPNSRHGTPHQIVAEWLDTQTVAAQRQDEGTSDILYYLSTFAERRDAIMDCRIPVVVKDGKVCIRATTRELLSDFRLLSRHLGMRCPWASERQLGTRLADAEAVLHKSGWSRRSMTVHGRRIYEYTGPHKEGGHQGRDQVDETD